MMKKGFIICLFICFLCINFSFATNNNNDTNLSIDSECDNYLTTNRYDDNVTLDTLSELSNLSSDNNILSSVDSDVDLESDNTGGCLLSVGSEPAGSSFSDLQSYIDSASAGDTLFLTHNYSYVDGDNTLVINKPITINGNGNTLNGLKKVRILNVNSNNVYLNNLNFINGYISGNGGAIYWNGNNGLIQNCNISNNKANGHGGAIYLNSGSLNIKNNVKIFNNQANTFDKRGGGIYLYKGTCTIEENVEISYNTATIGAGIYHYDNSSLIIQNNVKIFNNTGGHGGGLFSEDIGGNTIIRIQNNVEIFNNTADGHSAGIGVCCCNLTIQNNVKIYNNTGKDGAGLFLLGSGKIIIQLDNVEVFGNNATRYGGGLYIHKNVFVEGNCVNCKFYSNQALVNGSAFYIVSSGNVTLNNINVSNNSAPIGGAFYIDNANANVIIKNSNFTNNTANNVANSIYLNSGSLSLENNTINTTFAEIVNNRGVISGLNVTVLGNSTVDCEDLTVLLNASISDDRGNLVNDSNFKFTVNGRDNVSASYNASSKLYEAWCSFASSDVYLVGMSNSLYAVDVNTGVISGIMRGTFTDLNYQINSAYSSGVLSLPYNFTYTPSVDAGKFNNGVSISSTLTVIGNNVTINGLNTVRIFNVSGSDVVLDNITFVKGYKSNVEGGAIYWTGHNGNLTNCTFINNSVINKDGGAISWVGNYPMIFNCTFINNTATNNPDGGGGAIVLYGSHGKIINCSFINDSASSNVAGKNPSNAGAFLCRGYNTTIDYCSFDKCRGDTGSAICIYNSNVLVNNSIFTNNFANKNDGAIYVLQYNYVNIRIFNSVFINNSAGRWAGAIRTDSDTLILNCTFINNSAPTGGAYMNRVNNASIINCTFINNSATNGGVFYMWGNGKVYLSNNNISNNNASGNGGAFYIDNANVIIKDSNFTNNTANNVANSIYLNSGSLSLENNTINTTFAEIVNYNGVITSVVNVTVLDNKTVTTIELKVLLYANITDDMGNLINDKNFKFTINGNDNASVSYNSSSNLSEAFSTFNRGVYLVGMNYKNMNNVNVKTGVIENIRGTFTDLNNQINGAYEAGVLSLPYNFTYTQVIDANKFNNGVPINSTLTVIGNNFTINGIGKVSILNVSANNVVLDNITFKNGKNTNLGGGAIRQQGSGGIISNCIFINNSAMVSASIPNTGGGAIRWESINGTVYNCTFINNSANSDGGAIFNIANNLEVDKCIFINNSVTTFDPDGGAIWWGGNDGLINNSIFNNNRADYGATIFCFYDNNTRILNCSIIRNNATGNCGGIVLKYSKDFNVIDCNFIDNYANQYGVLRLNAARGNINNCNFSNNSASSQGIVYVSNTYDGSYSFNSIIDIFNCTFNNNIIKSGDGGVFYIVDRSTVNINNTNISNNSASSNGGVFYIGDSTVNITNMNISNNSANNGGVFYINKGTVNINNANVSNNTVSSNGGAFYINAGTLTLNNVNVSDNNASNGGAFYINGGTVTLNNVNIFNNTAKTNGGAIYTDNNPTLTITNNNIYNNNATENGGGLYVTGTLNIKENTKIYNNTALINGGAIYLTNNYNKIITETIIENNTAINGSAIYINGNIPVVLSNMKLLNNMANVTSITFATVQDKRKLIVNATFNGGDNFINAIWTPTDIQNLKINNITYWTVGGVKTTQETQYTVTTGEDTTLKPSIHPSSNQNITLQLYDGTSLINEVNLTTDTYGTVSVEYDKLLTAMKSYTLNAVHEKNNYYNYYTTQKDISIQKVIPEFVVNEPVVGYGDNATISIILPEDATGNVTINITEINRNVSIVDVYNTKNVTFKADFTPGSYTVNATYTGDENYTDTFTLAKLFVERPNTILNITVEDIHIKENATFNFTIYTTVDNEIIKKEYCLIHVYVDNKLYDVTLVNGTGQLNVSNLGIGSYYGLCMYDGDIDYAGTHNTYNFTVSGYETSLNVTVNSSSDIYVGDNVSIKITGSSLIDEVNLTVKNISTILKLDDEGVAYYNLTNVSEGYYPIFAVSVSDEGYFETQIISTGFNVGKHEDYTFNITTSNIGVDDVAVFNVTLPDDATGVVVITLNNTQINYNTNYTLYLNESRCIGVSGLSNATYTVVANYIGDDKYTGKVNSTTLLVSKLNPEFSVNITPSPVVYPYNVGFNITGTNGTYIIKVNDTFVFNVTVSDSNIVDYRLLDAGDYNVNVTYLENDKYLEHNTTLSFTVNRGLPDIKLNYTVKDGFYPGMVNVIVSSDVSGMYNVSINGDVCEVELTANTPEVITFSGIAAGSHNITVNFTGNNNYENITKYMDLTINKANPIFSVDVLNVTYNDTVCVKITGPDGLYNITVDENNRCEVNVSEGEGVVNFTGLAGGIYSDVLVEYMESENYTYSNTTTSFSVNKAMSSVKIDNVSVGVYNTTNVSISYTIINNTGNISFNILKDNIVIVDGDVGVLNDALSVLGAGTYTIRLINNENENYSSSNDSSIFTILKAASSVSINPISNVVYDNNVTIDFSVENRTNVFYVVSQGDNLIINSTIKDNTVDCIVLPVLGAGTYTISIYNMENENYTSSNMSCDFTILRATSNVKIDPIVNVTYNNSVVVSYTIINSTGNVSVVVKNRQSGKLYNYTGNDSGIVLPILPANRYIVTVTNNQGENYTSSSDSAYFTIDKAGSFISANTSDNIFWGDAFNITYTVDNRTNITMDLYNADGVLINDTLLFGQDYVVIPVLEVGDYSLEISNTGDENYNGFIRTVEFSILPVSVGVDLNLTVAGEGVYPGEVVVVITANHTGVYNLSLDKNSPEEINLKADTAFIKKYSNLTAGNHSVSLIFSEDNYADVNLKEYFNIGKADPVFNIDVADSVVYNENLTVKITGTSGVYRVRIDENHTTTITHNNETSIVYFNALNVDTYTVKVEYLENNNYNRLEKIVSFTVNKNSTNILISGIENVFYGTNTNINFTVINPVNVTWTIKDKNNNTIKTGKGINNISIFLGAGDYSVGIVDGGSRDYANCSATAYFSVYKASSIVKINNILDGVYNTSNVVVDYSLVNTSDVRFNISKDNRVVVLGDISALNSTLSNLGAGSYLLTIYGEGSENYSGSGDIGVFNINKAPSSVVIKSIVNVTYGDNVSVSFSVVNRTGIFYYVVNNTKGIVSSGYIDGNTIELPALDAGDYTVSVFNSGDDNYDGSNNTAMFSVKRADSLVVIDAINNVSFGSPVVINYSIFNETIKKVLIKNNGAGDVFAFSDNASCVIVPFLAAGNYSIVIVNEENNNYNGFNCTSYFTVNRANSSISVGEFNNVTYGDRLIIPYSVENRTVLNVSIYNKDDTLIDDDFVVVDDSHIFVPVLDVGDYYLKVVNCESENYTSSLRVVDFSVLKAPVNLLVNVSIIGENYPGEAFAVISSDVSGLYNLTIDNNNSSSSEFVSLVGGVPLVKSIQGLCAGSHSVGVVFSGDANYENASMVQFFTINKASPVFVVSVDNVTYNSSAVVKIHGTLGTYNIKLNNTLKNTVIINNSDDVSIVLDDLAAGLYDLGVDFVENENYTGISQNVEFSVYKNMSRVDIAPITGVVWGDEVLINFTVFNPVNVYWSIFNSNGIVIDNGTGEGIISLLLDAGDYSISVFNDGGENYTSSSACANFTVYKACSKITIGDFNNVTYGENLTVPFSVVNKTSVHAIITTVDGFLVCDLGDIGGDFVNIPVLDAGVYCLSMFNRESNNILSDAVNVSFTVNKVTPFVGVSVVNVTYPGSVFVGVVSDVGGVCCVSVGNYTRNVTLKADEKVDVEFGNLDAGFYDVDVYYGGSVNYNSALNSTFVEVYKQPSSVIIGNISPGSGCVVVPFVVFNRTALVINISDGVNTMLKYTLDGDNIIFEGSAGDYSLVIVNIETSNIMSSNDTINFTVSDSRRDLDVNITPNNGTISCSPSFVLDTLDDFKGRVNITVDGRTWTRDFNSSVSIDKLAAGEYNASFVFWGDDNYNIRDVLVPFGVYVDSTIISSDLVRGYNSSYDFTAVFTDEFGRVLSGQEVQFVIDGEYFDAVCDSEGVAKVNLKLSVGDYSVVCVNLYDNTRVGNSLSIVKRLTGNGDVGMYYDDGSAYKVRVVGDDGKFVGAGQIVKFTLNGKSYNVGTDKDGYASLVVSLPPKSYAISAEYKGYKVSNKVVVKSHFIGKKKVTVKMSTMKKKGYLGLSYNMGRYFAGKTVILKFPGKTYKVKVNSKGKLLFKVNLKFVNKLKVGKSYKYTLIYKLDSKSRNIQVYKNKLVFTS